MQLPVADSEHPRAQIDSDPRSEDGVSDVCCAIDSSLPRLDQCLTFVAQPPPLGTRVMAYVSVIKWRSSLFQIEGSTSGAGGDGLPDGARACNRDVTCFCPELAMAALGPRPTSVRL